MYRLRTHSPTLSPKQTVSDATEINKSDLMKRLNFFQGSYRESLPDEIEKKDHKSISSPLAFISPW